MTKRKVGVLKHYWDACIFIHHIQGGNPTNDNALKSLAQHARDGKIKIVTSSLTLAEVIKPRKCEDRTLSEADKMIIRETFIDENLIIVDVTQPIAFRARKLQWDIDGLKPTDAIHLATAEYAEVDYFDTTDHTSIISKVKGFKWNHPMIVGLPSLTQTELGLDDREK